MSRNLGLRRFILYLRTMQKTLFYFLLLVAFLSNAQEKKNDSIPFEDLKYREDQFYIGFTYNFINNKPAAISQQGFSGGFQLGFIRDLPLNKKRNLGLGLGLGYATNSYNQNLLIQKNGGVIQYAVLDNEVTSYSKNKLNMHIVEVPIQLRWRTSSASSHKFWRVYAGLKFGYVFNTIIKHKGEIGDFRLKNTADIQKIQTDLDLSFGWNTWNFYLSYGLQPLLKKTAKLNGKPIEMSTIKFGLLFYIF